jgi:hypothetical protein
MALEWLPAAIRDPKGRVLGWTERTDPKGCLHTTETSGWPGYNGWSVHPHATIMPKPGKGVEIRQNVPFSRASFSLRNLPGGVQTNTDYVFQFELIGTSERGGPGYFWPGADDAVLFDLYRKLIKPLSEAYKIPIKAQPFQSYPASYGPRGKTNTVRMSGSAFDNYSGWLGHQHVPENIHGDPGAFPWGRMMKLVEEADMPDANEVANALAPKVRTVLKDMILNEPLVRNKVLNPGDKPGANWTIEGVLAAGDQKADLHGRALAEVATALAELAGQVKELDRKFTEFAAAIEPPSPTPK